MSLLRSTIQALSMERPLLSSKAMNKWTEAFVLHLLKRTTNIKEAIFSIETYHCHNASMLANVSRCSMLASPCTKTACGQVPHTSTPHQVFHLQSVFPKENWEDEERYAPSPQPPLTHSQPKPSLMQKIRKITMEKKMHFESAIEAAVSVAAQIRYRRVPMWCYPMRKCRYTVDFGSRHHPEN